MDDVEPIIPGERITIADVVVDTERSELRDAAGAVVPLRPKALALLLLFASRPGRLVEREAIFDAVWPGITICDASLTQLVSELRRAMGSTGASLIRTVPKRGYIFEQRERGADVVVRAAPDQPLPNPTAIHDRGAWRAVMAVLPFVPATTTLESTARCVTGEVATALAQSPELLVAVRSHPATWEPVEVERAGSSDPRDISYVLEGSVRRIGDLLRISCRLSIADSGLLIWAQHFQYSVHDEQLYDGLARAVAGAVKPRLHAAESTRERRHHGLDREVYGLYLRAIAAFQGPVSFGSLEDADCLLRQSLQSDPGCMLFRSALAHCHALRHAEGWSSPEQIEEATQIARELIARGASEPVVLGRAAFALAAIAGDHAAALPALHQALALAPHSYFATRTLGLTHLYMGNWRGALTCFERAGRISNSHPSEHCRLWGLSFASFGEGRYARSAELAEASLRLGPDFTSAWRMRAASLGQMGRIDEARTAAQELLRRRPHFTLETYRAQRTWADVGTAERMDVGLTMAGIPPG